MSDINVLVPIVVAFVVVAFTISIGTIILEEASGQMCGDTYIEPGTFADGVNGNSTVENPTTSGFFGCCDSYNGTDCLDWSGDASINATSYGNQSLEELASWLPTLALVIIAAVIIGILIMYLARGEGGSV